MTRDTGILLPGHPDRPHRDTEGDEVRVQHRLFRRPRLLLLTEAGHSRGRGGRGLHLQSRELRLHARHRRAHGSGGAEGLAVLEGEREIPGRFIYHPPCHLVRSVMS